MSQLHIAILLDEARLTLDELAASCMVSREWIIEHVHGGVLLAEHGADPSDWLFSSRDVLRVRRLRGLEHDFDANPELAGFVADLFDELERLRVRLRRAGLPLD